MEGDRGDYIEVFSNAGLKNGRARTIPVETESQRAVLDLLKQRIPKSGAPGWTHTRRGKPVDLEYRLKECNRRMAQIGITRELPGVTRHGLRAEFSEDASKREGMTPSVLGGTADQMPKEDLDLVLARAGEILGHGRISVTNSYSGSFGGFRTKSEAGPENPDLVSGRATSSPVKRVKPA